jgi:U2 small nuclear ribonucleoprotein A'
VENSWAKSFGFSENPGEGAHGRSAHLAPDNRLTLETCQERQTAKSLFLTADKLPTALATSISTTVSIKSTKTSITTDEPKVAPVAKAGRLMSKEEADRVKKAIAATTSVEEIRKLERSLREGYIPERDAVGA